ncbi:MAG: serine O-acetyltransferase [Acetobacteraceae bacterium]|nr:serine O-acetyltransferase [Acetobacteraceae bacterium]
MTLPREASCAVSAPAAPGAWPALKAEARRAAAAEPLLGRVLDTAVMQHDDLAAALGTLVARKLADAEVGLAPLAEIACAAMRAGAAAAAEADLLAILERDPAADGVLTPFLHYKGFHALQAHRVAHWLWNQDRQHAARLIQARVAERLAVDIHPAVPIGRGVFIDHSTALVVGETATIGNDVSILQEVTLGGTGKARGDRHPKVHDGALLAAGAKVLGNIVVGRGAKVGAGSVVLRDVPPCATVAGVPARIVGWCRDAIPALTMAQELPG